LNGTVRTGKTDRMALISLTFDDGLASQLDYAIPTLQRHGLRGTFYLSVGNQGFGRRHEDWAAAAKAGHELANHTIFHPGVSSKSSVTDGIALESYSLDRMHRELVAANNVLRMLDGRDERTFAFPGSNPFLGRPGWPRRLLTRLGLERTRLMGAVDRYGIDFGSRLVDYTPIVRDLFLAARCGGTQASQLAKVPENRYGVRGVEGDGRTTEELLDAVEAAIQRDAWLVLVFHGIGESGPLVCDRAIFKDLIAHLAGDRRVRVLTFIDAAKQTWT